MAQSIFEQTIKWGRWTPYWSRTEANPTKVTSFIRSYQCLTVRIIDDNLMLICRFQLRLSTWNINKKNFITFFTQDVSIVTLKKLSVNEFLVKKYSCSTSHLTAFNTLVLSSYCVQYTGIIIRPMKNFYIYTKYNWIYLHNMYQISIY